MRDRPRTGAALTLAAAALLLPAAAPVADVVVKVSGMRSAKGVLRACMTADPERFPRCTGDAAAHRLVIAADDAGLQLVFRDVAPGRYAIALLHDENANGKADRALSMIPREGFGFSRDAPVRMGPPKFSDAAFTVVAGESEQRIQMRYML